MRLIDADALRDALQYEIDKGAPPFDDTFGAVRCGIRLARNIAEDQPTVDAVPVVHGKWKWLSCTYDRVPKEKEYECSECHHKTIVHGDDMPWEKYCPNCGADMRGEQDG